MKLAVMQPYFFPYIGYWQLMNAVDKFVIYDDVNYIKQGWINRNIIIENKKANYLTLPLIKPSPNKLINEITIFEPQKSKEKLFKRIYTAYHKAPFYENIKNLLESIILYEEKNLAKYLINSIRLINGYLNIETVLILSSNLEKSNFKKGQDKIIEICQKLNAVHYINPIGGTKLYSKEEFARHNIKLSFLKTNDVKYKQFGDEFIPNLSIIDVMMFNSREKIEELLEQYTLI